MILAIMVAGGLGAVARYLVDGWARHHEHGPAGLFGINVAGSFALGLVVGLVAGARMPDTWMAVVGTGLLGGFTTFSAASLETVLPTTHQVNARGASRANEPGSRRWGALGYALGMVVAAVAAAALGWALGSL